MAQDLPQGWTPFYGPGSQVEDFNLPKGLKSGGSPKKPCFYVAFRCTETTQTPGMTVVPASPFVATEKVEERRSQAPSSTAATRRRHRSSATPRSWTSPALVEERRLDHV